MDPVFAQPASTCGFPSTVGINGALCQGAHIGKGVVVTAAHCVDEASEMPAKILFGESYHQESAAEIVYDGVECVVHPSWNDVSQDGVDLAVCFIEDTGLEVPAVVMTPPDGCEVSYLKHLLRNISSCESQGDADCYDGILGVHVSAGPDGVGADGPKQFGASAVVRQTTWEGSPGMLYSVVPGGDQQHLQSGDSGAPFFMQMPDDSWRFLGVHSGREAGKMYTQSTPPYGGFFEQAAAERGVTFDATPCHKLVFAHIGWEYSGGLGCVDALHVEAQQPNATWSAECSNSADFGGGADGCGGWFYGIAQPPDPEYRSPDVLPGDYDDLIAVVESRVQAGKIACTTAAIEDAIREDGEYVGYWPFITEPSEQVYAVELYSAAPRDAVLIFRELCQ